MKKETRNVILAFFFTATAIIIVLVLLSSRSRSPFDSQHEKFGRKAVEIADSFLDFEISSQEAYSQISDLYHAKSTMPKVSKDDKYYYGNDSVETEVFLLSCDLADAYYKSDASDVLISRNRLAETLGLSAR